MNETTEDPRTGELRRADEALRVGDRVILPEGHVPDDWSRRGEVVELDEQAATVELDDGHRQDVVLDELEIEQRAQPRPGDRYRQKERPTRVVEVESVLTVGEAVSVEFVDAEGAVDEQPAGFTMSFPLDSFLEHFEPADAPTGGGVGPGTGGAG